jgi:hypothetical protein
LEHISISNDIDWSTLSAIPEDGIADKLQQAYQSRFIDNFLAVIEYAEQVLAEEYDDTKQQFFLLTKEPPRFISPKLYMSYFKLRQAMEQDDVYTVKTIISSLNGLNARISTCAIEAGLTNKLEVELFNEEVLVSFGLDKFNASSPNALTLNTFKKSVLQALTLIETADPIFTQEIQALVSNIYLVESNTNVGATSPKFFGAIYATLPPDKLLTHRILLLTDNIVHETSHLYLNAIMIHDPLILNDADELYTSPLRKTLRPMIGIYHAAFVLSRVIRVLKRILHLNLHSEQFFNQTIIDETLRVYEDSYRIIDKHANFTELGKRIHESTRACLSIV